MDSGATFFLNLTAGEFNTDVKTGASVAYKSGIQIVAAPTDLVAGSTHDCGIAISKQAGALGYQNGILFGNMNGDNPVITTGVLIKQVSAATYATGIDFSEATFNTAVLKSGATTLLDGGLILGNASTATRFIDFKSQGNPANYNARLLCQAGSITDGSGDVSLLAAIVRLPSIVPLSDANLNLGSPALRFNTVYASNGTINTSDQRNKQDIKFLSNAEKQVATSIKGLIKSFKFKDAVAQKGDKARIHFGVMAQEVAQAFEAAGLDPTAYALFCYDEWEADEKTNVAAGNRYGIRYDELLAFVISAL
jgi:hypothetical protein